jgi:hypothetical protein
MRFQSNFLYVSVAAGAVTVLNSYQTGGFIAAVFSGITGAGLIVGAYFNRARAKDFLFAGAVLLISSATVAFIGIASNKSVVHESKRVIAAVESYRAKNGEYPTSINQLTSLDVDPDGAVRVGSARIYMGRGTIFYTKFPGGYVAYEMSSKQFKTVELVD